MCANASELLLCYRDQAKSANRCATSRRPMRSRNTADDVCNCSFCFKPRAQSLRKTKNNNLGASNPHHNASVACQ